jgi:hypothetical protein
MAHSVRLKAPAYAKATAGRPAYGITQPLVDRPAYGITQPLVDRPAYGITIKIVSGVK